MSTALGLSVLRGAERQYGRAPGFNWSSEQAVEMMGYR
jgi:hypothetical protein